VPGPVIASRRPEARLGLRVDHASVYTQRARVLNVPDCVTIREVVPGSAADRARLQPDKLIVKVNGRPVHTPADFYREISGWLPGPAGEVVGRVLAGTDCPNVAIVSGYSLHRELELLTHAGLSPLEAITAATSSAAERLDRGQEFGSIAPGLAADLLILDADPLQDIRNTRRIDRVILNGVAQRPAEILAAIPAET